MDRLLLTVALLNCTCFLQAAEPYWDQFRGPNGDGHASEARLPVQISETENLTWKVPLEGKAWSSPVIWEKQIWVTNAFADGKDLFAHCYDLETGKPLQKILVFHNDDPQFCHELNSYATPTPVIENGRVYVHYGVHGTACIDTKSGETLWSRRDLECNHFRGPASSPILHENMVIVHFDGHDVQYVVALNKETGETIWKHDRAFDYKTNNGDQKKAYCTPSVFEINGQKQLICPAAVCTEALDPQTGEVLWTVRHGGMNASARPLYGHGLLYLTNGMGQLVAVNPLGEGDITKTGIVWESSKSMPKKASPLLVGDYLFTVNDSGVISCLEAKSGKVIWMERLDGQYAASPLLAQGRIYFFSMEGQITVIEAGPEYKLLASSKLDDGFMASPAVAGHSLILRTRSHLYRFDGPAETRTTSLREE